MAKNFFKKVEEKEEGQIWLKRMDSLVQFKLDGKSFFSLLVEDGRVTLKDEEVSNPDLVFGADAVSYLSLFSGVENPTDLWFDGKLLLVRLPQKYEKYCWLLGILRIGQGKYYWDKSTRRLDL